MNNFLDITKGGPLLFLEQNLLRFPQAKTSSSVYGSAIHKALEDAHVLARKDKKVPSLKTITEIFEKELKKGRLMDFEEKKLRERGENILSRYYELKKDEIRGEDTVELNFSKQSVMVDGALLTGKIDQIIEDENKNWTVIDLKTGKGVDGWDAPKLSAYEEIKLHNYRHQLMMYKILVENSRDYNTHTVTKGVLEFVEEEQDNKIQEISLSFDDKDTKHELEKMKKLIVAVYKKIVSLDFPDTSKYKQTIDGIKEFEEDLISGTI